MLVIVGALLMIHAVGTWRDDGEFFWRRTRLELPTCRWLLLKIVDVVWPLRRR